MVRYTKQKPVEKKKGLHFGHFFATGLVLAGILVMRAGALPNITSQAAGESLQAILRVNSGTPNFTNKVIVFTAKGSENPVTLRLDRPGIDSVTGLANIGGVALPSPGEYTYFLPEIAGYIAPIPATGRAISIPGTIDFTYHKLPGIKTVPRSGTELLEFTPNLSRRVTPEWGYLKGVASVASAGTNLWQYSEANLLYIQAEPYDLRITKTDGTSFVTAGSTTNYRIDFSGGGGTPSTYGVRIVDRITATNNAVDKIGIDTSQVRLMTIDPVTGVETSRVIDDVQYVRAADSLTLTITEAGLAGGGIPLNYRIYVPLSIEPDMPNGTMIRNDANMTVDGLTEPAVPDENIVLRLPNAFLKETAGGAIFSKRENRLTNPNADNKSIALYTIGAGGEVTAQSNAGWEVSGYGLRSDATLGIDDSYTCNVTDRPEVDPLRRQQQINKQRSGYCLMETNIGRMKSAVNALGSNYRLGANAPTGTWKVNEAGVPEGQVWYREGNFTINSTRVFGKGTIIVENGDVTIAGDLVYDNPDKDILGIIVKNGNIIIKNNVRTVNGIFYVYSTSGGKGSFITEADGSTDSPGTYPLFIRGLVVASGARVGSQREGAFQLGRTYVGDAQQRASDNEIQPAEEFSYDARIIVSPPPGFSRDVLRGRQ